MLAAKMEASSFAPISLMLLLRNLKNKIYKNVELRNLKNKIYKNVELRNLKNKIYKNVELHIVDIVKGFSDIIVEALVTL